MTGIIAAGSFHCEAFATIHQACFGVEAWSAESIASLFSTALVFGFIAPAGGMVIARAVADEAEILTIGVIPAMRRRGIAHLLLDHAVVEATRRGAATLFLEVAARNVAALALYRSARFEESGRRVDYYGPGRDAVMLRRSLCE